jgi:hypothetical protein
MFPENAIGKNEQAFHIHYTIETTEQNGICILNNQQWSSNISHSMLQLNKISRLS